MTRVYDLEDRLVGFSSRIVDVAESLPKSRTGDYLAAQIIRSGLAPALMYGEAQGAESRADFVHKVKLALKELKETRVCLKLIQSRKMINLPARLENLMKENEELIAILAKSIQTAGINKKNE